jgi:repressor LexA
LPHRARALEVVKLPGESAAPSTERSRFSPTVIRGDFAAALPGAPVAADTAAADLPLYGRIAAGTPIEALRDQNTTVAVPGSLLGRGREHYALEVAGDSMVDAGIYDGDTVIIERADTADNGAIVVALVDNEEVTLKRLRRRGASIALEPANQAYETRIFGPDRVKVQGRLVGLLRRYQ